MTESTAATDSDVNPNRYKTHRAIEKYGIQSFKPELKSKWTGKNHNKVGIRDLADDFNVKILDEALGNVTLESYSTRELYELLTEDDPSNSAQWAKTELEDKGIDVDEVTDDFVSHTALLGYLKNVLKTESPQRHPEGRERIRSYKEATEREQKSHKRNLKKRLNILQTKGYIPDGEIDITVKTTVKCPSCGRRMRARKMIDPNDGCECTGPR